MIKVIISADVDLDVSTYTYMLLGLSVPGFESLFEDCVLSVTTIDENSPVDTVRKVTNLARNLSAELNGTVEVMPEVYDIISDFDDADECVELLEEVSDVLV